MNLPVDCPGCGLIRNRSPESFEAERTLCTQCEDQIHDHDTTMEQEGRLHVSKYHKASRMFSAEWEWGHSHTCPDCGEDSHCNQNGCSSGSKTCQTCEDIQAADLVRPPEGYRDTPLTPSDLAAAEL